MRRPLVVVAAVYAAVCAALWPSSLFGILHVESAAVVAGVAFFASGLAAFALFRQGEPVEVVLGRMATLLAVPWLLLTVSLAWHPNCGYALGLLLFATFTVPSVALAVALAFALDASRLRFPRASFLGIGVTVALLPVAFDLGLHPQFYTYNPVWGGVLGPIYDEELAIRPGLFFAKGLTLWWAVGLWLIGRRAEVRRAGGGEEGHALGLGLLMVAFVVAGGTLAGPWLGTTTPAWRIQEQLGARLDGEGFTLYFDPDALPESAARAVADEAAYRLHQHAEALELDRLDPVAIYLYPDPETRAALTGSRTTSVAPVWLPTAQVHLLQDRAEAHLAHELAHAVARQFGMPVLRASPAVGLVEGLAVALEPPSGRPPPHAQVAAALADERTRVVYGDSLGAAVARQLTVRGFWGGRGAVGYTTMGSFVRFLLDEYGAEPVKTAYRTGRFDAFSKPLRELAAEWEAFVRALPVEPEATTVAAARFAVPSLFEVRCPHHVPRATRLLRRGFAAMDEGNADAARDALDRALVTDSSRADVLAAWARLALLDGREDEATARLEAAADSLAPVVILSRLSDAYRLAERAEPADSLLDIVRRRVPPRATEARLSYAARRQLSPEALAVLLAPEPPASRAERLAELGGPAASYFAALLYGEAERWPEAVAAFESARGVEPGLSAARLGQHSRAAHRAGDRATAALLAREAASAFETLRLPHEAARWSDRAELADWAGR